MTSPVMMSPEHQQLVYTLFAREVGPLVKNKYPSIEKMQFNQILGRIWSELPPGEKNKYVLKADFQRKQQLETAGPRPALQPLPGASLLRQSGGQVMAPRPPAPSMTSPAIPAMRPFERYAAATKMVLVKQYPYLSPREIEQLVLRMWSQLSEVDKARYNDMSVMRSLQQQLPQMVILRKNPTAPQQHQQQVLTTPQVPLPPAAPTPLDGLIKVKVNNPEKTENIFMRDDDSEDEDEAEEEAGPIKKIPFAALGAENTTPDKSDAKEAPKKEEIKEEGEKDNDKDSIVESDADEGEVKVDVTDKKGLGSKGEGDLSLPPAIKIIPAALESRISGAQDDQDDPDDPDAVEMPEEDDVPSDEDTEESGDDDEEKLEMEMMEKNGEKLTDPLSDTSEPSSPSTETLSENSTTEIRSLKNKVSPIAIADNSPPPKSLKVGEKPVKGWTSPEKPKSKSIVLENPEKSSQRCNTCKVLVDEVKKRGDLIEKLQQKIEILEAERVMKQTTLLERDGLEVA